MVLHCAATPTVSPPAARPCRLHHGACGALPHPAAAPARALGLGDLLRLVGGGGDARADRAVCRVRRRVRYEEDEDEEDDEEWGHNEDVARMERYTEDARDQALLVKARVDDEVGGRAHLQGTEPGWANAAVARRLQCGCAAAGY